MRETDAIDPMWEGAGEVKPGPRLAATAVRWAAAAANRLAPTVVRWAAGFAPEVRMSWGARIYHLRRDGLVSIRRGGEGYEDNPRRNYNTAVEKRQARAAAAPAPEPTPSVDLSEEAMAAEVAETMGISADLQGSNAEDDAPPTAESVKERLVAMRTLLQNLDDVGDYDLVEAVDDELYLLHKAVDYKLKNHKASEAKAKLDTLFK